jgi:hypothetical protein
MPAQTCKQNEQNIKQAADHVTSPESISGRIEHRPRQLAFAQLAEVDRQAKQKVSELPQAQKPDAKLPMRQRRERRTEYRGDQMMRKERVDVARQRPAPARLQAGPIFTCES